MNAMSEESWALSVTEATMQEWLAAMTLLPKAPEPVAMPWTSPWPEDVRPAVSRATPPRGRRRAPAPIQADVATPRVAGARTAYWVLLALSLAAMLVF
jgi:hypothetical protein